MLTPEQIERRRLRSEAWRRAHGIGPRKPTMTRDQHLARRRAKGTAERRAAGIRARPQGYRRPAEENRARVKAWRETHPEKARELKRRAQAVRRARNLGAYVERVDPRVVWQRDEGVCHLCGQSADLADWHLDHVIPLARGGGHSYANVAVSHPKCNLQKGARLGL